MWWWHKNSSRLDVSEENLGRGSTLFLLFCPLCVPFIFFQTFWLRKHGFTSQFLLTLNISVWKSIFLLARSAIKMCICVFFL